MTDRSRQGTGGEAWRLPPDEQEAIAREFIERLEADERWEKLLADPRSEEVLRRLAAEAADDVAFGRALDNDPASRPWGRGPRRGSGGTSMRSHPRFRTALLLFQADPWQPGLHFKRVNDSLPVYSARIVRLGCSRATR